MTIRVVFGDDSYLAREAILRVLEDEEDIDVIATCSDYDSLRSTVGEVRPDVVLADISMPPTHTDEGIRLAAELRRTQPDVGVVILSQYAEPVFATKLLEESSDRRAYLLKERVQGRGDVTRALRDVAAGRSIVDPRIVELLLAAQQRREDSRFDTLTPREQEILALVAEGLSNAAIAERIVITKRAVERHINSIFSKLGLADADALQPAREGRAALPRRPGRVTPLAFTCVPQWRFRPLGVDALRDQCPVSSDQLPRSAARACSTVDDDLAFLALLRELVCATAHLEIAGEADSGEQAIVAARELRPDMVLMDVRMPGMGGMKAAELIKQARRATLIVMISTTHPDEIPLKACDSFAGTMLWKSTLEPRIARRDLAPVPPPAPLHPGRTRRMNSNPTLACGNRVVFAPPICPIRAAGRPAPGRPRCRPRRRFPAPRARSVDEPVEDDEERAGDDHIGEQDREWLADAVSVEVDRVSQEQIGVAGRQERAEIASRTRGGRGPRSLLPMRGCRIG